MKFFASNTQTYYGEFLQALLLLQQLFDKIPYFSQPLKSRPVPSKKKKNLFLPMFFGGEKAAVRRLYFSEKQFCFPLSTEFYKTVFDIFSNILHI